MTLLLTKAARRGALPAMLVLAAACGRDDGTPSPTSAPSSITGTPITKTDFGEVDGMTASIYELRNRNGLEARITDFGAILIDLRVPDRDGSMADVVLGFDELADYAERNDPGFGSTIGRYANRIAQAAFELDGRRYELAQNDGRHHLHGGLVGFNKVLWKAARQQTPRGPALRLLYTSPDGEEGYPGTLTATVVYTLTHDDELHVEMSATTETTTVVNLAHHTYWNLAGHDSGDVLDHTIELGADRYTPTDDELIPTGELAPVDGTPFDLRTASRVGQKLDELASSRDREPPGFDENFVLTAQSPGDGGLRLAARVQDPSSGRMMELYTDQPGVQLYTGNFLDGIEGKGGATYGRHAGLCLETQLHPDAVNKVGLEGWPSPVLRPGETYTHVMVHRFSTDPRPGSRPVR